MRILFTGATSFTGHLFVEKLIQAGHTVIAPLRGSPESYSGLRKERLEIIKPLADIEGPLPFGSASFLTFLEKIPTLDMVCHHASDVTNYKSPDFDAVKALENNTLHAKKVLELAVKKGAHTFILTGSIFEQNEGAGSEGLPAVSPYGLSKGMTADFFRFLCPRIGLKFKKFVIPNPFGPFEEMRFTSMVAKLWLEGKSAQVTHGRYVRDNIPSTMLAEFYLRFLTSEDTILHPSGYAEMQSSFALRFQQEMKKRFQKPCLLEILEQKEFSEPRVRINYDLCLFPFDEAKFWDETADFYLKHYSPK